MCDKSNRERLVEKIKALLEHTTDRGASEAEAAAFALKAQQLMLENGISDADIDRESERVREKVVVVAADKWYWRQWRNFLADVIAPNFRCRWFNKGTTLGGRYRRFKYVPAFIGYESDAAAALAVFDHLYEVGEALASAYVAQKKDQWGCFCTRKHVEDLRKSYLYGFCEGVRAELEKQSAALMVSVPLAVCEFFDEMNFEHHDLDDWQFSANASKEGKEAGRDAVRAGRVGEGRHEYQLSA